MPDVDVHISHDFSSAQKTMNGMRNIVLLLCNELRVNSPKAAERAATEVAAIIENLDAEAATFVRKITADLRADR